MFSFLQPKEAKSSVPQSMIMNLYYKYRLQSLIGIFIGYAAYYIVRNNFALSTHFFIRYPPYEQNRNWFAI